ncbi:hypothetical protein T484DRAFT_1843482 [Baffinella frigidus]|nr:hypothetical protein T484DRAFT_1843482 [Cryptophyta sp. CCMP2293]
MEQAAGLLHKAKKASGDEKASLLERLLTLVKGITAAPTFLDELLPLVLELHDEDSRAFVAQFVEESCRRRRSLLPSGAAALLDLAQDDSPQVLIHTMCAVAGVFRWALLEICNDDGTVDEEEAAEMWEAIQKAATVLRAYVHHEEPAVCNAAVMLVQVLALDLTERQEGEMGDLSGDEPSEDRWSMSLIPACHAFLGYVELKKEGEECVKQLLELLEDDSGVQFQTLLLTVNCLGRLARNRPQLLPEIEPALSRLRTTQPLPLAKWQLSSLHNSIKSTLLGLLKLPSCSAYAAVIVERLQALGAQTQAEAARRMMEKTRLTANKRSRGSGGGRVDPRLPSDPADKRARAPVAPLVAPERIPKNTPLEEWPADLVTFLVMEAMVNYPAAGLPPHLIAVAETPLSMWPERLAFPSVAAEAEKAEGKGEEADADDKDLLP